MIQKKTQELIAAARAILEEHNPMTVRQVFYQLVSGQVLENTKAQYKKISNALVWARQEEIISWDWIEDRLRRPRSVSMWNGLPEFIDAVRKAYRRDVWDTQPGYLEVWLEKDALSGIFERILDQYGVTLNVGRGYDGWDSIHNAAMRYLEKDEATILYFGDFDPSGEDMVRSLGDRLRFFGCDPDIIKSALTMEDIKSYNLPPDFTKKTDTRAAAFIAQHGDISVELDALPVDVLQERIRSEVISRMDMEALVGIQELESKEREKLERIVGE